MENNFTQTLKNFTHIPYSEKVDRAKQELIKTDPTKVVKRWRKERDNMFWWIFWGTVYVIWAETGTWKSTFVNQVCRNVAAQWWRVVKYSLEDRMEDIGKQELFYMMNRYRHKDWLESYQRAKFVCNEYAGEIFDTYLEKAVNIIAQTNIVELDKTGMVSLEDLVMLMEEEAQAGTRMFAIDHLHYFEFPSKDRMDIQIKNAMHAINEVARKYNVAILLIAHYRKNTDPDDIPSPDRFKDWSAIKQVANMIIQLQRNQDIDKTIFHFTKFRWPIRAEPLSTTFDIQNYKYDFQRTDEQIKAEKTFNL